MDTSFMNPASLRTPPAGPHTVSERACRTPREVLEDGGLTRAEKREILAFWASDACAVESCPALRLPPGALRPMAYDDIMRALRELDGFDPAGPPFGGGAAARPSPRRRGASAWRQAGAEPTVEEALADPVVRLVMARDGVRDEDVRRAMAHAGLCRGARGRVSWRG